MQNWMVSWLAAASCCWFGCVGAAIAEAEPNLDNVVDAPHLRPPMVCPDDLNVLAQGLLRDVPSYANRVVRRTVGTTPDDTDFGTVILAGRAELEPLAVETLTTEAVAADATDQLFFTTLERRYVDSETVYLEQYHWLFLVRAEDGWRLTLMFSRTASDDSDRRPPTPAEESSYGIMGQAVRLWLRDCRAGALYPIESLPSGMDR